MDPSSQQISEQLQKLPISALMTRAKFAEIQRRDVHCHAFLKYIENNELPNDDLLAAEVASAMDREMYSVDEDGLLLHFAGKPPTNNTLITQIVVPKALVPLVLKLGHDDASAMHPGISATHKRIAMRYFWPKMAQDIRAYVSSCIACQKSKAATSNRTKQATAPPSQIMETMHVDVTDMKVTTPEGFRYVLSCVDKCSGFPFLYPMKEANAETCVEHIYKTVLNMGGQIPIIISDQGREFVNDLMDGLCEKLNMMHFQTSAYHPAGNSPAESTNRELKKALRVWAERQQVKWAQGLDAIQFALRSNPRTPTGLTPFFAVYAREAVMPYDMLMHDPHDRPLNVHERIEQHLEYLVEAQKVIEEAYGLRRAEVEKQNEKIKKQIKVKIGEYVWVAQEPSASAYEAKRTNQKRAVKMDPKYTGPWKVVKQLGTSGLSYYCRLLGRTVRFSKVHISNMKRFHDRPKEFQTAYLLAGLDPESLGKLGATDVIDTVIDRRMNPDTDSKWQYKIRKRDGSTSDWLDESVLLMSIAPWELDTFHAIFELRHPQMPRHAKRAQKSVKKRTKAQALELYPMGTKVARECDVEDPKNLKTYVLGKVAGFCTPWWRIRYEDGVIEDMSRTQLRMAVDLFRLAQTRKDKIWSPDDNQIQEKRASEMPLGVKAPGDFGRSYVGSRVRVLFATGWCTGTLTKLYPKKAAWTFDIQFDGEERPRRKRLRAGGYCTDNTAIPGDWYLLTAQE